MGLKSDFFQLFVVFGSRFPDFCSQNGIFYKQLVASGNSAPDPPDLPDPLRSAGSAGNEVRPGRSDPGIPHAGEQDDGSFPQNSLKQACFVWQDPFFFKEIR